MAATAEPARRVPGEPGLWVFVLGDMTVFALLFGAMLYTRAEEPAAFAASREELSVALGAVNTLVLLTSSLLVALAVPAYRAGRARAAGRLLLGAGACAAAFAGLKAVEWSALIGDGHDPGSGGFFTYYFAITGLHLLHLLLGTVGLAVLVRTTRRAIAGRHDRLIVEAGATYWHMVDLLWVVIFPLVYFAST